MQDSCDSQRTPHVVTYWVHAYTERTCSRPGSMWAEGYLVEVQTTTTWTVFSRHMLC
jgi:hypothetical protein